jgi:hypothetical protein
MNAVLIHSEVSDGPGVVGDRRLIHVHPRGSAGKVDEVAHHQQQRHDGEGASPEPAMQSQPARLLVHVVHGVTITGAHRQLRALRNDSCRGVHAASISHRAGRARLANVTAE